MSDLADRLDALQKERLQNWKGEAFAPDYPLENLAIEMAARLRQNEKDAAEIVAALENYVIGESHSRALGAARRIAGNQTQNRTVGAPAASAEATTKETP